jgi:hypothetical protein
VTVSWKGPIFVKDNVPFAAWIAWTARLFAKGPRAVDLGPFSAAIAGSCGFNRAAARTMIAGARNGSNDPCCVKFEGRQTMRNIVFALAIAAFAPLLTSPASAQVVRFVETGWPVCLSGGEEASTRCEFPTVAQCRVISYGGRGTCILNPNYNVNAYAQMRSWY